MNQRFIKPGRSAAGLVHPKTGEAVTPIGYRRNGTAIWPVMGASSDDPDDPKYTGGSGKDDDDDDQDDDDEDDEDDEDEEPKSRRRRRPAKKVGKHAKDDDQDDDDDDDDDDDEDNPRVARASRQAAKYRTERNQARAELADVKKRLKAIEDKDKPADEIAKRDAAEREQRAAKLEAEARETRLENAFLRVNIPGITWVDTDDVFALMMREDVMDDVMDESGTVDRKALARFLRDLAKRKPHLVVKSKKASGPDDDDEEDDDDQRSASTPTMNGKRRGSRSPSDRDRLAKRFPVLGNRR